jgi:hypothetical protein
MIFDLDVTDFRPKSGVLLADTPAPVTDLHFAIVRIPVPDQPAPFPNTVMAAAVNDQDVPTKIMKGDKILCRQWFSHMSQIMTAPAFLWATRPNFLWINDRYYQDADWPEADRIGRPPSDREPISECIYYPCNFIAYDYRVGDWLHLVSYDSLSPPTNPFTDNWLQKPWLWGKAQALSADGLKISNVGAGLDVYLPLIRKTQSLWMHATQLEIFPDLPFILDDGTVITSYTLQGADVIGQTQTGTFLYLRKVTKFGGMSEPYNWHLAQRGVIPPT